MGEPNIEIVENMKIFIFCLSILVKSDISNNVGFVEKVEVLPSWAMFILRQVNNQRGHEVSFANK